MARHRKPSERDALLGEVPDRDSAGSTRSPTAACRGAGRRWSAARPAAARRCWRWSSSSAASREFDEPGVFMAFEETAEELAKNVASLGFDLDDLVRAEDSWPSTTSASSAARSRRPASTTWRACSSGWAPRSTASAPSASCSTPSRRSSPACPTRPSCGPSCAGCSAGSRTRASPPIITGEQGDGHLTRHGLEEYVSDCVIVLDHRVHNQIATRRLRIVKYRGSTHGTNEYPFLIDEHGLSVLPISSLGLDLPGQHASGSPPASRGWTRCWAARATTGAAAS